MSVPKDRDPQGRTLQWGSQDRKPHLLWQRLTHAAGGFTAPGWPGTIEADEGLLTLQLVARITVEGGSASRVKVCHTHIPMGWPGREAAAQEVGWIRQSRRRRIHSPRPSSLTGSLAFPPLFPGPPHPPGRKLAPYWSPYMDTLSHEEVMSTSLISPNLCNLPTLAPIL